MKKTFIVVTGLLVTVAVLFVHATESLEFEEGVGYAVGDMASDFALPNVDGKTVSMKDFNSAKGFIVTFTCNTCPYAKLYENRIIELDKKFRSKGYPVIAINPNDVGQKPEDGMDEMIKRSKEKGYTFPYLRDDSQEVAKKFGATKTPHIYLLNKEGNSFRVEYIGAIDDSPREEADVRERYVEDAIMALLAGKKPEITEKRAIGCTIKWKES